MTGVRQTPQRVLFFYLGIYPLFVGFLSGGETRFVEICRRLVAQGARPTVVTGKIGPKVFSRFNLSLPNQVLVGVPFEHLLCRSDFGLSIVYAIRTIRAIPTAVRLASKADLVCCTSYFFYDVFPAVIVKMLNPRIKLVVYIHHLEPPPLARAKYHFILQSISLWVSQKIVLWLVRMRAELILTYPSVRSELIRRDFRSERIRIMKSGVDMDAILRATPSLIHYEACFLGRLTPTKGIFDLVRIWRQVCESLPSARIAIIGSQKEKYLEMLSQMIRDSRLEDNVSLLGTLTDEEKFGTMKSSMLFLCPSHEEGFGIAILEAMGCGLPVIAYNLAAYDQVRSKAMVKIRENDTISFAAEVVKLLRDESARFEISGKAKEVAGQFDWESITKQELENMGS